MKKCARCGREKPLDQFRTRTQRGRVVPLGKCRECERAYQSEWQAANRDKVRQYKARWQATHREQHLAAKRAEYERNKDRAAEYMKGWRERNPEKIAAYNRSPDRREDRLRRTHGISLDQFHEMWERQDGRCPICLRELPREYMTREELAAAPVKPHVDHSHDDDVIRGLLCSTCNQGIGLLREDPEMFRRAAVYLSGQFPTITPQRSSGVPNGEKVECKYGHAFTEVNTRWDRGRRHCRICDSAHAQSSYRANPKPCACLDCGVPVAKPESRCRSCAGKARRAARLAASAG